MHAASCSQGQVVGELRDLQLPKVTSPSKEWPSIHSSDCKVVVAMLENLQSCPRSVMGAVDVVPVLVQDA